MSDSPTPHNPSPSPTAVDAPDAGKNRILARLLSVMVVLGALALAAYLLSSSQIYPQTDDAYIQARYITVAAEVPGRILHLDVSDGAEVSPGSRLLQIDPASYVLAVEEASAQVAALEAQLQESERQRAASLELVDVATENIERTLAQQTLIESTYERLTPLAEQGYVSRERYDTTVSELEQIRASVLMAKSNALAAELSVPSVATIEAELKAARIRVQQAELELRRTQVDAPFRGWVVNCDLAQGEMVSPGEPLFTLVDASEWFVIANYREGDLQHIPLGAKARVRILTQPDQIYTGEVISIGHAVQTQDAYDFGPLPTVRSQLNWVRLAQRFPVRIRIDQPEPESVFRIGASAVVTIESP